MIRMASSYFALVVLLLYLVRIPFAEGCGETYTSLTGTIESPNFPNNYTNNLNCSYVITAPVGYRVTINLTQFDLEITAMCQFDYVEIRHGKTRADPVIDRLCNTSVPIVRRSVGNHMWIKFVTDDSITGYGFRATFTSAKHDDSFFLITSNGGHILRMDTDIFTNYVLQMSSTLNNPIAVDYDPVDEKIYWTEVNTDFNTIRSANLDGTQVQNIHDGGPIAVLDGIAVDPLSRLVFFTDAGNDVIAMLTMSTRAKKTVVSSNLDRPRAIVLDVVNGVMFWTDWGAVAKIERANYDGSDRRTLVSFQLYYTNALALDVANNRLYWVDAGTDRIESSNLYGNDRKVLWQARQGTTRHFFGMALFQNNLYITDWLQTGTPSMASELYRFPLEVGNNYIIRVGTISRRLNDIHAYHQDSLITGPNGCGNNNGGCSVMCIPLPSNNSKCMCPDGQRLSSDQKGCENDDGSISTTTTSTTTPGISNIAVYVTASERLPFETDGSQELTLTCRPDTTVQVTQYKWSVTCARQPGNTCVFLPKPEDDMNIVSCNVTLADGRLAVGRLEIMLEYPPQTPPVINGYKKGNVLQTGDDLRLTCSVQGGKPLVKNVIFSCDGHPDTAPDIRGRTEVHSVLEFKPLKVEDNGKRCICTAEWKDTDWYRLSVITTLIVNGKVQQEEQKGPSVPIIAGGAAAGVVVIIIIVIVVVVFVVKRRNQHPTYDRPGKRRKSSQAPINPYTGLGHVGDAPFAISNGSYDAQSADRSGVWNDVDDVNRESLYAKIEEVPEALPPPIPSSPSLLTVASTASTDSYLHPAISPDHGYAGHVASDI